MHVQTHAARFLLQKATKRHKRPLNLVPVSGFLWRLVAFCGEMRLGTPSALTLTLTALTNPNHYSHTPLFRGFWDEKFGSQKPRNRGDREIRGHVPFTVMT